MAKRERIVRVLDASRCLPLLIARPRWEGLLILNHHRIGEPTASPMDRGVFSATPDGLDAQIAMLKRTVDVIAPRDVHAALETPRGRHVLLTFDDGYRDNYDAALPVLLSHDVHATFFLCPGFIDNPLVPWWDEIAWMVRTSLRGDLPMGDWRPQPLRLGTPDREQAIKTLLAQYKTLPASRTEAFMAFLAETTGSGRCDAALGGDLWMTWDMARAMAAAGMEIGGHTLTHPVLARLALDQQRSEIAGCQDRLRAELGAPARHFAYPVGGRDTFTSATQRIVADAGFDLAFSFYGGYSVRGRHDPYDVPRAYVAPETSPTAFEAMLAIPQILARETPAWVRKAGRPGLARSPRRT